MCKNSCEKNLYFSLCKKEKIVDLDMNSVILNGPPVFSNFLHICLFLRPKYKVYCIENLQTYSAYRLLQVGIFFENI
jgi:hypothetical protein